MKWKRFLSVILTVAMIASVSFPAAAEEICEIAEETPAISEIVEVTELSGEAEAEEIPEEPEATPLGEPEAVFKNLTTGITYSNLKDAMAGASDGDTLQLLSDCEVSHTASSSYAVLNSKDLKLDLAGYTLSFNCSYTGPVTFIELANGHSLEVFSSKKDGVIYNNTEKAYIRYFFRGSFNKTESISLSGIRVESAGKSMATVAQSMGTVTLSDVDFSLPHSYSGSTRIAAMSGTVTCSGCSLSGNGDAFMSCSSVVIKDKTVIGITGQVFGDYEGMQGPTGFTIEDSTVKGRIGSISSGTIKSGNIGLSYAGTASLLTIEGGKYTASSADSLKNCLPSGMIFYDTKEGEFPVVPVEAVLLTFYETPDSSKVVEAPKDTVLSEVPSLSDTKKTFAGWTGTEGGTELVDFTVKTFREDTSFWPVWKVTVSFETGCQAVVSPAILFLGQTASEPSPAPENPGYVLTGWELSGETYDFRTPVNEHITLTAKWEKLPATFTVTFDTAGGTEIRPQTVTEGETAIRPEDPVKEGYRFAGWVVNEEAYDFSTPVTEDLTLTAKWEKLPAEIFTVTFMTDGGTEVPVQTVENGEKAVRPEDPEKEGFLFDGWYGDNRFTEAYDFEKPVESDTVIYAKWKKKSQPVPEPVEREAEPLFTGTWQNPVLNGRWSQDASGIWHYQTTGNFRNTWGYILNPYAREGQNPADWFYFDSLGNMLTGWQYINGKWYYLNPTKDGTLGACQLGGVTPDGWTVDENGAWIAGIPKK